MKITIRNSFHETTTTTKVGAGMRISKDRLRRIRRTLCGMDCSCGDIYTATITDNDGNLMYFYDNMDGGGEFVYA